MSKNQKPSRKITIKNKFLIVCITGWLTYGGFCNSFAYADALVWQDMNVSETTTIVNPNMSNNQVKQEEKSVVKESDPPVIQMSATPQIRQDYIVSFADMQKKQMAAFEALQQEQQKKDQKYAELLLRFNALQKENQLKEQAKLELSAKFENCKKENQDLKNSILQRDTQEKAQLVQIDLLKQKIQEKDQEIQKRETTIIQDITQDTNYTPNSNANAIYAYKNGNVYQAYCQEKMLTEIQLQPGEELNFIGGGDTDHWVVQTATSGNGFIKTWHIYIKPLKPDISTDIVITTSKRSYKINVKSTTWYTPMISFNYPEEQSLLMQLKASK